ncbi:MAG: hypothetical protein ACJ8FY_10990 [Gemmataceae bacterium]
MRTPKKAVPMPMATPKVKKLPPDDVVPEGEEDEFAFVIGGLVGGAEYSIAGAVVFSGGINGLSF